MTWLWRHLIFLLVNKIRAERMHQFGFHEMVACCTGSNPIEISDTRSKVKVTVIEKVSQNDEKYSFNFEFKCKLFLT